MKKTIALILTLCALSACHSRREEYKPKDTETDTLAEIETEEDVGGVLAEYAYGTNPYAGIIHLRNGHWGRLQLSTASF